MSAEKQAVDFNSTKWMADRVADVSLAQALHFAAFCVANPDVKVTHATHALIYNAGALRGTEIMRDQLATLVGVRP